MLKTAIFGTSYIYDHRRAAVVRLWIRLAAKLNPGFPLTIVDSASPVPVPEECGVEVIRFPDNVGHLAGGGKDGWGRAFTYCLKLAVERGMDYVAVVDTDIVLCKPVGPIFDMMRAKGIKCAMPIGDRYPFPENGLVFFDVAWLKRTGFADRYGWEDSSATRLPEWHCRDLCGRDLHILTDLKGRRNDHGDVTADNLSETYPTGCDWLTHCVDTSPYAKLLELNGLDVAELGWQTV